MKYRELGETKIKIPVVGMGTADVKGASDFVKVIKKGIDLGMTLIDTAEVYDKGVSEELVGQGIRNVRKKVIVASKVSPENLSCDDLLSSLDKSLKRLKSEYIDLYQIHWTNPKVTFQETAEGMLKAIKAGKIRYIGICNCSATEIDDFNLLLKEEKVVSLQVEYNLRERYIEKEIVNKCLNSKTTIIAYSPLLHGKLSSGNEKIQVLRKLAEKYNKTLAQIALNWVVHKEPIIAIPKTTSDKHLTENAGAADFVLDENEYSFINNMFKPNIASVPTDNIHVSQQGIDNRKVYNTMEEALANKFKFTPSPLDLADDIRNGHILKPVKVVKNKNIDKKYEYELIEGRIRYWAWVIAFKGQKPIEVLINEDY